MVDLGFSAGLKQAFDQWHGLVEGNPKLAEQAYFWEARRRKCPRGQEFFAAQSRSASASMRSKRS